MAYNDDLLDKFVHNQIQVLRLGNGYARLIGQQIRRAQAALYAQISSMTVVAGTSDREVQIRLQRVEQMVAAFYRELRDKISSELVHLADWEVDATIAIMTGTLPSGVLLSFERPSEQQIIASALRPTLGYSVAEWFDDLSATAFKRISQVVRAGFIEGLTPAEIARTVRDNLGIDTRGAQAIARTIVASTAQQARQLVFAENDDLIEEILWVSTLDNRTTPICQERDGKVFPVNEGPRPPAHINCRSTTTPIVKGADALGLPPATRASMNGQVPEDMTYADWIKRQPLYVQEEVLGKTRAELLRKGGLELPQFINDDGRYYTLDDLRKREPGAFNKIDGK